jgi:hypothetical protein
LKIYLSEAMYRMMWDYFFPEEDDSQRRQVVCKFYFHYQFVLRVLISYIYHFCWDERKFGEFQHRLDLKEQEDSLLVWMLLPPAAVM